MLIRQSFRCSPVESLTPHRSLSTPSVQSFARDQSRSIAVGDLDGDESPDLVIADHYGHQITWFRNLDGVGGFSAGVAIDTDVYYASNVKLGDIDNDGDLDVVAAIKLDSTYICSLSTL